MLPLQLVVHDANIGRYDHHQIEIWATAFVDLPQSAGSTRAHIEACLVYKDTCPIATVLQ